MGYRAKQTCFVLCLRVCSRPETTEPLVSVVFGTGRVSALPTYNKLYMYEWRSWHAPSTNPSSYIVYDARESVHASGVTNLCDKIA